MKSNAIVRIIIWSLILLLLTGILGSALIYRSFLVRKSAAVVHEAVLQEQYPAQSEAAVPLEKMYTFPVNDVSELEIEWVAGEIIIYPTDRQDIAISEAGATQTKYGMTWNHRDNCLNIKFCDDSIISGIGTGIRANLAKDLYIYVPADWVCHSLEIDAASADLDLDGMTSGMTIYELDIDGASGTCEIRNCDIRDLDIDTASGDITFSGTLDTLDFDAASASFIGDFTNTPSRIDMDSMSGRLDISLPEDCGYTLSMDGMSSSFRSDFQGTAMKNNSHVYGDGRCRIHVDGMNSDVTIRKSASVPAEEPASTIEPTQAFTP